MKIYVLFEKKTFGDGDRIYSLSTSKRKIKKLLKEKKEEVINEEEFILNDEDEYGFVSYDEDGNLYQLTIEEHETLK